MDLRFKVVIWAAAALVLVFALFHSEHPAKRGSGCRFRWARSSSCWQRDVCLYQLLSVRPSWPAG